MYLHLFTDIIRNSVLITGLVTIMMMLIESVDLESGGRFFKGLKKTRTGQVAVAALLGTIPGCIGGFAAVSLYSQRLLSFGALVAMMVASCGDEAFMMLALDPWHAACIFAVLFAIAVFCGVLIDIAGKKVRIFRRPSGEDAGHGRSCRHGHSCGHTAGHDIGTDRQSGHAGWKRILLLAGTAAFIAALISGLLDHDHHMHGSHADVQGLLSLGLLDEKWMNILFGALSIVLIVIIVRSSDAFIEDNLWHHILLRHAPVIFLWTFSVLAVIGTAMTFIDLESWISENTAVMILLAAAIGLIPESGPHMVFVSLFAGGIVPFPVLLASCISQDGHSSLPLLAEDKKSFAIAKLINFCIAVASGYGSMLIL